MNLWGHLTIRTGGSRLPECFPKVTFATLVCHGLVAEDVALSCPSSGKGFCSTDDMMLSSERSADLESQWYFHLSCNPTGTGLIKRKITLEDTFRGHEVTK